MESDAEFHYLPETITEILALRKQVGELSRQLQQTEQASQLLRIKHQRQQHLLDDNARYVDELQAGLRRVTRVGAPSTNRHNRPFIALKHALLGSTFS